MLTCCAECGRPQEETVCDDCLLRMVRVPSNVRMSLEVERENRERLTRLVTHQSRVLYGDDA